MLIAQIRSLLLGKMYTYDALIESTVKQQTLQPLGEMRK